MDILEALHAEKPTEDQKELLEWVGEDCTKEALPQAKTPLAGHDADKFRARHPPSSALPRNMGGIYSFS